MVLAIHGNRTMGVPVVVFEQSGVATAETGRSASGVTAVAPTSTGELVDGFAIMPWSGDIPDDRRLGDYNPETTSPRSPRPGIRDFEAKIRHYNSDLKPTDPAFRAAVILLAGLEYGHNIDMLARKTGYDRAFVSRTARRLIDNGVWKAGVTIADWSSSDEASGTFWNDVAVAEGKMCRRINTDGRVEWAPAGFWNKNFQFVDPGADKRLATLYLDATAPEGSAAGQSAPETPVTEQAAPVEAPPKGGPAAAPDTLIVGPVSQDQPQPNSPAATPPRVPKLEELFRDVIWIG
jgi:hypothetical protein